MVANSKAMNDSQMHRGVGRSKDSMHDQFVLTRYLNVPGTKGICLKEKINNYVPRRWKLSRSNECHIC